MSSDLHAMDSGAALELLARSPRVHLFVPGAEPSAVSVCPVLVDDALVVPWSLARPLRPQANALVVASEHVASLPQRFGSGALGLEVRATGALEPVTDERTLAAASRLGGRPWSPFPGASAAWWRLNGMALNGSAQLAQERSAAERTRLLEALWERGLPEDPRAIDLVRRASPSTPTPPFLEAPQGVTLVCAMQPSAEREAVHLLEQTWHTDLSAQSWGEAHRHSSAWVGARNAMGGLIATARAVSDWSRDAWIYDVMVASTWRGKGVGYAVMQLLLEHPALRHVKRIRLRSAERAQTLYARFGFKALGELSPAGTLEMCRIRPG